MSITKNTGRQTVLTAIQRFTFDDLETGVALEAVVIPGGAYVVDGELVIETAFNSATSDVIAIGDSASETGYLGNTNSQATGRTSLVPAGAIYAANDALTVRWTGVGTAPTAGVGFVRVSYVIDGRAVEVQP